MPADILKRVPPHNVDAEKAVLAAMIIDREKIPDIEALIIDDDFYNKQYGAIYNTLLELYNGGVNIDVITLRNALVNKGFPDELTSSQFLADLVSTLPTSVNASDYARVVKDMSTRRKIINLSDSMSQKSYAGADKVNALVEEAEDRIYKISREQAGDGGYTPIRDIMVTVGRNIEKASRNKDDITGVPTGFSDLDRLLSGLHEGELILVAARPSMGKTAFALNIAHHVAIKKRIPTAIFTLEMREEELGSRLLAMDSRIDAHSMRTGDIRDNSWDTMMESMERIGRSPIYIFDDSDVTVSSLKSQCRKLKSTKNLGLIIIDYLQLMTSDKHVESRQLFISEVSRGLKGLAKDIGVPVIALSQLSRAPDQRQDHRPVLSDLRESGSIEQDADVVMFIYRDEVYNQTEENAGKAQIIVAKQRAGSTGIIDLVWQGKYTRFANLEYSKKDSGS